MKNTNLAAVETTTSTPIVDATLKQAVKAAKQQDKKEAKPAVKKATKKATKKSTKPAKKAAKKVAARKAEQVARKSNVFTATAKVAKETFTGQKMEIVKALGKNGATRADLIAKLPTISAANISWYLSNLVLNGLVKKTAQK